jgi:hypothetical protein
MNIIRTAVPEVKLKMPERAPVMLRLVKGSLKISQSDAAVILMIQGQNDTCEGCITIKSGDSCDTYELQQKRMAIIYGYDEVDIWLPAHVVLDLILHPKWKSASATKAAT